MIYLTTGGNGASKTLLTLYDVRQQQLKENRPVYYHGFTPVKAVLEDKFGWKPHEPDKWMDLPDGSILIWDEAQTYIGARQWGNAKVPQWVSDLGVHRRKRGFDIWICCPHPSFIHVEVRRLIASPSWHRHLKRVFGSDASSQITYDAPNIRCEEKGAGENADTKIRPFPKEVYTWYESASLHTGKVKIPKAVYFLGIAAIAVPLCGYLAYASLRSNHEKRIAALNGGKPVPEQAAAGAQPGQPVSHEKQAAPKTPLEYAQERTPRFAGLAYTAPVYDAITAPVVAPYPAACIATAKDCKCYTQQGTVLVTQVSMCQQIVQNGFFVDWQQPDAKPEPRQESKAQPVLVAEKPAPAVIVETDRSGVDLVNGGRDSRPTFAPALVESSTLSVPTRQQAADAALARGVRTGDWTRN